MTLFILRHGQTKSNCLKIYAGQSDEPLEPEGESQARTVGDKLLNQGVQTIFSSPRCRAKQTAEIISTRIGGPSVEVVPELNEMRFGPWEGLSEAEVAAKYPKEWRLWLTRPAELRLIGRETLYDLTERAVGAVEGILGRVSANALVVTHVALMRCLYMHYNRLDLNDYKKVGVDNCEVFALSKEKGKLTMRKWE